MERMFARLTIGGVAKAAGVNVETIRFYQRKGLLPQPRRLRGAIGRYGAADLARLRFVKSAQRLGFSLDEVAELLRFEDGMHCDEASRLAERKLADVREKLAVMARMESALSALVGACRATRKMVTCPLISTLLGNRESDGNADGFASAQRVRRESKSRSRSSII